MQYENKYLNYTKLLKAPSSKTLLLHKMRATGTMSNTTNCSRLSHNNGFEFEDVLLLSGCRGYIPKVSNQMFPQPFILSSHEAGVSWLCMVSCDVPGL